VVDRHGRQETEDLENSSAPVAAHLAKAWQVGSRGDSQSRIMGKQPGAISRGTCQPGMTRREVESLLGGPGPTPRPQE
jgi:hypothetical protein